MIGCVIIGTVTGTIFLVVLLFVSPDIDTVIKSAATPLLAIIKNATNNNAGAICLLVFPLVCMLFATTSIMTTSSRMIYAFARYVTVSLGHRPISNVKNRDGGLPASKFFAKVHNKLKVPLNALYLTLFLVVVFGCIFLGSSRYVLCFSLFIVFNFKLKKSSAFNAIVSSSVVMLDIAYVIPITVNCARGRNMLPERSFVLPNTIGWIANIVRFPEHSLKKKKKKKRY